MLTSRMGCRKVVLLGPILAGICTLTFGWRPVAGCQTRGRFVPGLGRGMYLGDRWFLRLVAGRPRLVGWVSTESRSFLV